MAGFFAFRKLSEIFISFEKVLRSTCPQYFSMIRLLLSPDCYTLINFGNRLPSESFIVI